MSELEPKNPNETYDQEARYIVPLDINKDANTEVAIDNSELSEWNSRRLLFVTGPHASGKSAVVHSGFNSSEHAIHDLGPIIRESHRKAYSGLSLGRWIMGKEAIYGDNFTDELLVNEIQPSYNSAPTNGLILVGSRSLKGIEFILDAIEPSDHKIVYIDAHYETLYDRYKSRENLSNLSHEDFRKILDDEVAMGLHGIKNHAHHTILNNSTLDYAKTKLVNIVNNWKQSD
jgi:dephospho-CoA kinase